jgi:hypothetical protein
LAPRLDDHLHYRPLRLNGVTKPAQTAQSRRNCKWLGLTAGSLPYQVRRRSPAQNGSKWPAGKDLQCSTSSTAHRAPLPSTSPEIYHVSYRNETANFPSDRLWGVCSPVAFHIANGWLQPHTDYVLPLDHLWRVL